MRVVFDGLENPILIEPGKVSVVQINNRHLFSRVYQSLRSGAGPNAIEPYMIWGEDDEQLRPNTTFIVIDTPLDLPIKHKSLGGKLYSRLQNELFEDEEARSEIQLLANAMNNRLGTLGLRLCGDYSFAVEWDPGIYLKAFNFCLEVDPDLTLLDKLIGFIDFVRDMQIEEVLLFVNLKAFLTQNEFEEFAERLFFHRIPSLILETIDFPIYSCHEEKIVIDQHFIEYVVTSQIDRPSSTQGRICSNGFGAVTF